MGRRGEEEEVCHVGKMYCSPAVCWLDAPGGGVGSRGVGKWVGRKGAGSGEKARKGVRLIRVGRGEES